MRIGIGCTTYKRPEHLKLWHTQIIKHTPIFDDLFIADDSIDRKGIAYRKNECLRALRDCDYIFLFDDDTLPIKDGWAEFFINAHKASGQHHFMYLKESPTLRRINRETMVVDGKATDIDTYNNCAGCMMFLTKEVIERVGGFGKYLNYGFEHAGYSDRIHKAGLTPLGAYTCPTGVEEYILSMDYDYSRRDQFQRKVKHRPSMGALEMKTQIALNKENYWKDILQVYQPLEPKS